MRPPMPEPPPKRRSIWRVVVVLAGLFAVGALGGFGVATLLERGPCEGASFVSTAYGYCVDTPEGWDASPAADEPSGVDAFRDTDAATVVYVEAVRLPEAGAALADFADSVRVDDSLSGLALTEIESGVLAETPSLEWDVVTSADGVVMREIVTIRGGVGWRLQIADPGAGIEDASLAEARELLGSWRFA
jgi:hypothetical protein